MAVTVLPKPAAPPSQAETVFHVTTVVGYCALAVAAVALVLWAWAAYNNRSQRVPVVVTLCVSTVLASMFLSIGLTNEGHPTAQWLAQDREMVSTAVYDTVASTWTVTPMTPKKEFLGVTDVEKTPFQTQVGAKAVNCVLVNKTFDAPDTQRIPENGTAGSVDLVVRCDGFIPKLR